MQIYEGRPSPSTQLSRQGAREREHSRSQGRLDQDRAPWAAKGPVWLQLNQQVGRVEAGTAVLTSGGCVLPGGRRAMERRASTRVGTGVHTEQQ